MTIREAILKMIIWLKGSADNSKEGASSKKISAFWGLVILVSPVIFVWLLSAFRKGDWTYLPYVLDALLLFILGCLGVNAWEKKQGVAGTKTDQQN